METDSRARTPDREKGDLNGGKPRSDLKKLEAVMKKQVKWSREKVRKMVTGNASKRIRDHIMENESHPKFIKFNDKLAFTFGVLNICASQHFLLNKSDDFWMWYSIMLPLLMVARFRNFKKQGYQYFMLDFCYFTQLCTFLMMYVVRGSPELFKTVFIYANGPLTFAILAWRNSLVFHDYEKMTSVFIHLLPCMLTYSLRWHVGNDPAFAYAQQPLQWADLMRACLGYSFWQVAYYAKTEVWDKSKLDSDPSLSTSLRYLSGDKKNALARTILKALRVVGVFAADEEYDSATPKTKMVFMASQFVYTLVTFAPTPFLYHSSALHLIYIILIFSSAVFYGAGYYIEIFSSRYQLQFENKAKMQKVAETAAVAAYNLANANRMAYEAASASATASASASSPGGSSGTRPGSTTSNRAGANTASIPPLPTIPGPNRRPNTAVGEDSHSAGGTTGGADDVTSAASVANPLCGGVNRPSSLMLSMEDSNASLSAVTAGLAQAADALSRGSSSADMQSQAGWDDQSPVGMSMSTSGLVSVDGQSGSVSSSASKQSTAEGGLMQEWKDQQQGAADAGDGAAAALTAGAVTTSSSDRVADMSTEVASNDGEEATTSEEGEGRASGADTATGGGETTEADAREAAEEAHWARDVNAEAQAIIAEATSALIDEMMSQHSSSYDDEDMDGEGSGSGRGSGSGSGGGSDDDHSSSRGRFDSGVDMGMGGDSDDDEHAVEYDFEGDGDIADAGAVDGYDSDRDSFVPHNPHSIVSEDVVYPHDLVPASESPTLEAQEETDSSK